MEACPVGSREQDGPRIELIDVAVSRSRAGVGAQPPATPEEGANRRRRPRLGGALAIVGVVAVIALAVGLLALSSRGGQPATRPDTRWYLPRTVPEGYQLVSGGPLEVSASDSTNWRRVYGAIDRSGRLTRGIQIDTDSTSGAGDLDAVARATMLTTALRSARQLALEDGRTRVSFVIADCGAVSMVAIGLSPDELVAAVASARCTTNPNGARFADLDAPTGTGRLFDGAATPMYGARSILRYERGDGAHLELLVAATVPPGLLAFQGTTELSDRDGRRVALAAADPAVGEGRRAMAADAKRATIIATAVGDPSVDLVDLVATSRVIDSFTWRQTVEAGSGVLRPSLGFAFPKGIVATVRAGRVSDDETITQIAPRISTRATVPQMDLSTTRRTTSYAEGFDVYDTVAVGDQTYRVAALADGGLRVITEIGNARIVATARSGSRELVLDVLSTLALVDESALSRSGVQSLFGSGSAGR
jgi:hypothetical protein